MTEFNPEFLDFDKKVKESFLKQSVMKILGINLISVKSFYMSWQYIFNIRFFTITILISF